MHEPYAPRIPMRNSLTSLAGCCRWRRVSGWGWQPACGVNASASRSFFIQVLVRFEGKHVQRVFVVGCPRSGTTLVQAMLARHPDVLALAETAFFPQLYGDEALRWGDRDARPPRRYVRARMGLARRQARAALVTIQGRLALDAPLPPWPLRLASCAQRFVSLLDTRADADGRGTWVEKTPCHLLYIPEITRVVPGARFVHVIRRGEDVLASMADANLRFVANRAFGGGTVLWSRRWNRAAQIHREHARDARHHFVFLDDLLADQGGEWQALCDFLDLDAEAPLDETCGQTVADLLREPWKRGVLAGRPHPVVSKRDRLFGPDVLAWLHTRLTPYDELRRSCKAAPHDAPTAVRYLRRCR